MGQVGQVGGQVRCRGRWGLVALTAAVAVAATALPRAQARTFDLLTATVADIQSAVDAGALTYERLVQLHLNRIDAYDKQGPKLASFLYVNPKALD